MSIIYLHCCGEFNILKKIFEPLENRISILLVIFWIFGILVIWITEIQAYFLDLNLIVYPGLFQLKDIIYAFVTLLAILPAVTLTSATIATSSYGYKTLKNFKEEPYFWGLIILFLINILAPYLCLIYNIQDLRIIVSIELTAFLSFLFIIPYFLATFNNIIFEKIIEKFVDKINRSSLLQTVFQNAQSLDIPKDDPSFNVFNMLTFTINNRDIEGFSIVMENYSKKIQNIINDLRKKPLTQHPIKKDDGLKNILNKQGQESYYTGQAISNIAENVFQTHIEDISKFTFKYENEGILIDIVKNVEFLTTSTWNDLKNIDYPKNTDFWVNGTIMVTEVGKKACYYDMPDLIAKCLDSQAKMGIFWARHPSNEITLFPHKNFSWNCQLNIKEIFIEYIKINRKHDNFIIPRVLYNEVELLIMRLIYQPQTIHSYDFDNFESIIKNIIENKIHTIINFDAYFDKLIIPILMNIEAQRDINKIKNLVELIFTLFPLPHKIVVECKNELLKNKRSKDNTLILNYKPEEWYNQIIRIIRNLFYLSIKKKYNLSQLNLFDLYRKLLIIFIRIEEWAKVEELTNELNKLNKYLKDDEDRIINPILTFEQLLYVLLHLNKSKLFIKTVNYLEEEAITNTKTSVTIFKILASIGVYCQKWNKNQELLKVISSLINIYLKNPEYEKELNKIEESYNFHLDEGYFLTHTIGRDRKDIFSDNDKSSFIKQYYLEKIKIAKKSAIKLHAISKLKIANKQSKILKKKLNKNKNAKNNAKRSK